MTKKSVPKCLEGLESVKCTNGILAWIFLENHEDYFRVPVGSIEGPGRTLDPVRIISRVPWYGLYSLKGKNIAHTANFPLWGILEECEQFLSIIKISQQFLKYENLDFFQFFINEVIWIYF